MPHDEQLYSSKRIFPNEYVGMPFSLVLGFSCCFFFQVSLCEFLGISGDKMAIKVLQIVYWVLTPACPLLPLPTLWLRRPSCFKMRKIKRLKQNQPFGIYLFGGCHIFCASSRLPRSVSVKSLRRVVTVLPHLTCAKCFSNRGQKHCQAQRKSVK